MPDLRNRHFDNCLRRGFPVANVYEFSERIIDLAERLEDVADAAQGKRHRKKTGMRWLLLPAAGVGLFALGTSRSFTKRAKKVVVDAKERASDLPEDLTGRVQQAVGQPTNTRTRSRASARKASASRRRTAARSSR
jgi:hypothetical protein